MKKILFAIAALILGVGGILLRRAQLTSSFHPDTKLLDFNGTYFWPIFILCIAVIALAKILALLLKKKPEDTGSRVPSAVLLALAAGVFFYAGLSSYLKESSVYTAIDLILLALLLFSVLVTALLAYGLLVNKIEKAAVFSSVPVYWGVFTLLVTYRNMALVPQIELFMFPIFAIMCFSATALCVSKAFCSKKPGILLPAAAFGGIVFSLIAAFGDSPFLKNLPVAPHPTALYTYTAAMALFCLAALLLPALPEKDCATQEEAAQ